jgi:hypothetical protein
MVQTALQLIRDPGIHPIFAPDYPATGMLDDDDGSHVFLNDYQFIAKPSVGLTWA